MFLLFKLFGKQSRDCGYISERFEGGYGNSGLRYVKGCIKLEVCIFVFYFLVYIINLNNIKILDREPQINK